MVRVEKGLAGIGVVDRDVLLHKLHRLGGLKERISIVSIQLTPICLLRSYLFWRSDGQLLDGGRQRHIGRLLLALEGDDLGHGLPVEGLQGGEEPPHRRLIGRLVSVSASDGSAVETEVAQRSPTRLALGQIGDVSEL